jgi:hypothetical protein
MTPSQPIGVRQGMWWLSQGVLPSSDWSPGIHMTLRRTATHFFIVIRIRAKREREKQGEGEREKDWRERERERERKRKDKSAGDYIYKPPGTK